MMKDLTFTAMYQGKRSRFVIVPVSGGAGSWHLLIDDYYKGKFSHRDGRWTFLPQHEDYFTPEQLSILEERLTKHYPI